MKLFVLHKVERDQYDHDHPDSVILFAHTDDQVVRAWAREKNLYAPNVTSLTLQPDGSWLKCNEGSVWS